MKSLTDDQLEADAMECYRLLRDMAIPALSADRMPIDFKEQAMAAATLIEIIRHEIMFRESNRMNQAIQDQLDRQNHPPFGVQFGTN